MEKARARENDEIVEENEIEAIEQTGPEKMRIVRSYCEAIKREATR